LHSADAGNVPMENAGRALGRFHRNSVAGKSRRWRQHQVASPARSHSPGAADRLRECGQPAAGTGGYAAEGNGGTRGARRWLAVAEVALGIVLVIAAGLMVKSLWELSQVNPGFRSESILTARITPNQTFCADFARCQTFYNDLLERTRALPGVENAAVVNMLPLSGRINAFAADLEDHPRDPKDP